MSFQLALDSLKEGMGVSRKGWHPTGGTKNHYITLVDGKIKLQYTNGHTRLWEPTQEDILAEDWDVEV